MATKKTEVTGLVPDEQVSEAEVVMAAPTMNINGANGAGGRISEAEIKRELETAQRILGNMKTKTISIPKQMAPLIGESYPAFINGVKIVVPVDGESYDIPEAYYDVIKNALKVINSGDVRRDLNLGKDVDDEALISPTKR